MRAVSGARVRRRLGYHHDHRRVGATGMVVLMEPGGRPSLGQVSSCQCTMVAVQKMVVIGRRVAAGRAVRRVLSESTHLPLALPVAHAGSVLLS